MRISLNWLKELVAVDLSPEELAHRLTMAGFEVEDIEDRRTWADGVVVGWVLEREQHPNADRLSVCRVDVGGDAPLTIVCGAANVRADIFVAVATLGTYLPQIDLKLKPTKLRGVASEGMICSLAELGLEKESSGIHIFPQGEESEVEGDSLGVSEPGVSLAVGQDVRPLLGLDDVILDVTSTANRADALSLVGIAREVRALTGAALHLPEVALGDYGPMGDAWAVGVREPKACAVYSGTLIEGVTVGVSPLWLQRRLQSAGVRPINNVVDVTNYVLLEWGQPLHAFDGDRLRQVAGAGLDKAVDEAADEAAVQRVTLGVRFARGGEMLQTLDGQSRTLQEQSLVITAGSAAEQGSTDCPVALAGVMGGEATEVYEGTRTVFLEAAWFDPVVTRRSARSQGLRTEASGRYERGVNPLELPLARQRALDLLLAIAGGTIVGQDVAQTLGETEVRTLTLRYERVIQVLGLVEQGEDLRDLEPAEVEQALTALGCSLTPLEPETKTWTVTIPPYRYRDLEREIDLIEEVARLYGYDSFCDTLPAKSELGMLSVDEKLCRILRQCLTGAGLTELIHYSLGKPERSAQVQLANPLLAEYSALRTDLLSGLIDAFQYNWDQGNGPLHGFELGRVFWSEEEGLHEADRLAGILGGDSMMGTWVRSGRSQPLTWYEAKGVLDSVLQRLELSVEYQPDRQDKRLHPGRTASLWVQGERLGTLGQLHPQLVQERGLPDAVYAFELDLDVLLDALATRWEEATPFQPYSAFPASDRDLAFYVDRGVSVADLQRVMRKVGKPLLESAEVFDQYEGATVTEGRRSLAFRLVYRASDRTLTETDVDPIHQAVREALVEKYRVDLRS